MLCIYDFTNTIYKIVRVNRLKKNTTYIFVGLIPKEYQHILTKHETYKTITEAEKNKLKKYFGKNFTSVLQHKTKNFHYVFNSIYSDDTIYKIKQKILAYCSRPSQYLFPENVEIWVQTSKTKSLVLGTYYETVATTPSLSCEVKPDYKHFVDKLGESIIDVALKELEDLTLHDALQGNVIEGNEIYIHYLDDELEFLKEKKRQIDDVLMNGYILKFWPHALIEGDAAFGHDKLEKLQHVLNRDEEIEQIVNETAIDENHFRDCSIIQALIHVKTPTGYDFVDLLKIFTFYDVDEKMPFKRYKDPEWAIPYIEVYEPLVINNTITKKQLQEWIINKKLNKETKMKEVKYSTRGLTLKYFMYMSDEGPKYATLNIHRNGSMEIRMAFRESYKANIQTVQKVLNDIGKMVKKINEIDYRLNRIAKNIKISPPQYEIDPKTKDMRFINGTQLILIDSIATIEHKKIEDYKKLTEFSYLFTPYLSPVLYKKGVEDTMTAKYKRISNYSKMNEIYEFIHKTLSQNPNLSVKTIIELLGENFGKTIDESMQLYKDWEQKYGFLGTSTRTARQTGVEIKIQYDKIHIKSARTVRQLYITNTFATKFVELFWRMDEIEKNRKYRPLFAKNRGANSGIDDTYFNAYMENKNIGNELYKRVNRSANLGAYDDDNYTEYLLASANNSNSVQESKYNTRTNSTNSGNLPRRMRDTYLATDQELPHDVLMQCDDRIPEKDICADFCEDDRYALRRLQRYDNTIFRYRADPKYINFARECQPKTRQPIVMYSNPENNPRISRTSYTYAIKYGSAPDRQNYYICPRVWCPYEEIPLDYDTIKNRVVKRPTKEGMCETALCPSCEKNGVKTYLRVIPEDRYYPYPGFVDSTKHPAGLCMPCCQKLPWNTPKSKKYGIFRKCMGEATNDVEGDEGGDYIMSRDKIPIAKGRFGQLPALLAKLFNSRCDAGYMQDGQTCFLRIGVKNDDKQSFMEALVSLAETDEVPLTKTMLKSHIFGKRLDEKTFLSLKQGLLATIFNNGVDEPMDLFKRYMDTDDFAITEEYLWDYVSRRGVLFDEGVNIFILTSNAVVCPIGENCETFFDPKKKFAFIYNDRRFYEVIARVKHSGGKYDITKLFDFEDPFVQRIYDIATSFCKSRQIIDWDSIRKANLGKSYYEIHAENTLDETLAALNKHNIEIKEQLVDSYNKSVGFILKTGLFVPFKPHGLKTTIPYNNKATMMDYGKTVRGLYKLSRKLRLNVGPLFNILDEKKQYVIAILLHNDRIIPVKKIPVKNARLLDNSAIKYYSDADMFISSGVELEDERRETVKTAMFQEETFQRFIFELGRFIQSDQVKGKMAQLIGDKGVKYYERRTALIKILYKIVPKIISSIRAKRQNYNLYERPNIRRQCQYLIKGIDSRTEAKKTCDANFHCAYDAGGCKLYVPQKDMMKNVNNIELFIQKLADTLLNNRMKYDEIMNDKIDDIIDKKKVTVKKDTLFLSGLSTDLMEIIDAYYSTPSKYKVNPHDMYDTVQPKYYGINKEKYLLSSEEMIYEKMHMIDMPQMWTKYFNDEYKVYDEKLLKDTLFYSVAKVFENTGRRFSSINDLKQMYVDKLSNLTDKEVDDAEYMLTGKKGPKEDAQFKLVKMFKQIYGGSYKSVATFSDLISFIMTEDYPANELDTYFIAYTLNIRILLLEKRISRMNPKGYYIFNENAQDTAIFLVQRKYNFKIFNPIIKNGVFLFDEEIRINK